MADTRTLGVSIAIDIQGSYDMAVGDLWPDGDAPEVITAGAIKKLMEDSGHKSRVLHDWCLDHDLKVMVYVNVPNPAHTQDETLIGDAPPKRLSTQAEVWE